MAERKESGKKESGKIELKEKVNQEQFLNLLHRLVDGLEQNREFDLQIRGEACPVPANVLQQGELELEYELKQDKTELEIKLEWSNPNGIG